MRGVSGLTIVVLCLWLASAARAEPGDQAAFDAAVAAFDAGRYDEAYARFTDLADEYDLAAMRNVALMLRRGLGVPRDAEKARRILARAARAGLLTAQADLGMMLLDGEGGPADPAAAALLLTPAASLGHPVAQFRLGEMYESGNGVPQDRMIAERLFAAAAEHGVPAASERLAALKGWTYPPRAGEPAPGQAAAREMQTPPEDTPVAELMSGTEPLGIGDAARPGDDAPRPAERDVAHKTRPGPGDEVPADVGDPRVEAGRTAFLAREFENAVALWRAAAEDGVAEGQFRLGQLYLRGEGVNFDAGAAAFWWRRAAEQGHLAAIAALRDLASDAARP